MNPRDIGWLLVLSVIWGTAFMMSDVAVDEVPPMTIVGGRLLVAALMLVLVTALTGRRMPPRSTWALLALLAVTNNLIPFALITWAQQHITSSLAATLNATMPLFVFAIAAAIGSEHFDASRAAGVVIGFAGAAVLIGPDVTDVTSSNTLGQFAVIGGSLGYAVATVIARERIHGEPLSLAAGQMMLGALFAVPLAFAVDGAPDLNISAQAGLAWLGLGVLSSGLAYIIYFGLIQRVPATSLAMVSYLIPVVAAVTGWAVLDEHLGVNLFLGLALILVGMMAVNGTPASIFGRARTVTPASGG